MSFRSWFGSKPDSSVEFNASALQKLTLENKPRVEKEKQTEYERRVQNQIGRIKTELVEAAKSGADCMTVRYRACPETVEYFRKQGLSVEIDISTHARSRDRTVFTWRV